MLENSAITIGGVRRYRSLAVAPVYAKDDFREDVLMLDEAMKNRRFSVRESGEVRSLLIDNDMDNKVLIACGMLMEGLSQNRYSKYPCLVMPHTHIELPVNCAQQGQGLVGGMRGRYDGSSTIVMPSIRSGEVSQDYAWNQIQHTTIILHRMDPTRDYAYADRTADISDYIEAIGEPDDGQVGIVAGIRSGDQTLYYTDFFGNNKVLRSVHPKLAKSFGIVARVREGDAGDVGIDDLVAFMRSITMANGQRQDHAGGGELYLLDNPVKGSVLVYDDSTVQVSMRQDNSN